MSGNQVPGHIHVVGAGLAGLAAALSLTAAGKRVTLHDAAPQAGGRCRSYFDAQLGCRIDNGNHLLLSGNRATFAFLDEVGTRNTMAGPGEPLFPFMDLATGERWTLRPNRGRLPWWLLVPSRRVPGMRLGDTLAALRLSRAAPDATVAQALPDGALYRRLWEPLAIAGLNTMPEEGSARLLGAIVDETLGQGGSACVPAFPREGLSESFIDPAVAVLRGRGATLHLGARVGALGLEGNRVAALDGARLGPEEAVVLAVPAAVAAGLLPGIEAPDRFEAIINLHFKAEADGGKAGFMGLVNSLAEWVFAKPGVTSVTISAGNRFLDRSSEDLAQQVWADVQRALRVEAPFLQ